MAETTQERERLRTMISEMLRKVPANVASGSVQTSRAFKRFYAEAQKTLASQRTSQAALERLFATTMHMYR